MDKSKNITIPEPMGNQSGINSWLALNKYRVGLSLLATGLIGFIVLSRFKKNTTETQREPAHGRLWNINLDPHESGMAV